MILIRASITPLTAVRFAALSFLTTKLTNYNSPGNPNLPGEPSTIPGRGNLIDPVAQKVLSLFPLPNIQPAKLSIYNNWIASGATPSNNEQFDIKIDHRFNEKNLLSAKYSQEWSSTLRSTASRPSSIPAAADRTKAPHTCSRSTTPTPSTQPCC